MSRGRASAESFRSGGGSGGGSDFVFGDDAHVHLQQMDDAEADYVQYVNDSGGKGGRGFFNGGDEEDEDEWYGDEAAAGGSGRHRVIVSETADDWD